LATKRRTSKRKQAEDVIDLLVEMRERAHESWLEEIRDIETVAGIDTWESIADRLAELLIHVRAGAPLERTETDGS